MSVFRETNYKKVLKTRLKEESLKRPSLNLKKIAKTIRIQYTYLSKVMNSDYIHLSEDHLYEMGNVLNFLTDEMEYVLLLRNYEASQSMKRKEYLKSKILYMRNKKEVYAQIEELEISQKDIEFLLSPLHWIIYFILGVPSYRENPKTIARVLGISQSQLEIGLQTLKKLSLIEVEKNIYHILRINKHHFHYNVQHPLTRVHQQMLRSFCDTQLLKLSEEQKKRFMVTFNADEKIFLEIQEKFSSFLRSIEKRVLVAPNLKTYQMNFELFEWG